MSEAFSEKRRPDGQACKSATEESTWDISLVPERERTAGINHLLIPTARANLVAEKAWNTDEHGGVLPGDADECLADPLADKDNWIL